MKRYVKSSNKIYSSSMAKLVSYMDSYPCCMITGFRQISQDNVRRTNKQNKLANKDLEQLIKQEGFTYISVQGQFIENLDTEWESVSSENTFFVVDNKYSPKNFIELMIEWCNEFNQDAVLITLPIKDKKHDGKINVIGRYYNKFGQIEQEFSNVTTKNITDYYTKIKNKKFTFSNSDIVETESLDIYGFMGRGLANIRYANRHKKQV